MVEQELQATGCSQRTTVLIEITTNVGYRTSRIIRSGLNEDSDTERTISLIVHLLIIREIFGYSTFNGTLHVLLRHILLFGVLHQHT